MARRVVGPLVGPLLAALLLGGCAATGAPGEGDGAGSLAGTVHAPYAVRATPTLTDTEGEPFSLADDTDADLTLVFFGYTQCPDVCQVVMGTIASAMTRLDDADRERVQVLFVTTDPKRDTPQALRDYLDRFDPRFEGLTGDLDDVAALAEPLAVYVAEGQPLPSGGRDLNSHSTQVSGVLPDDTSPVLWPQDVSAAELAGDVEALLGPDRDRLLEEGM